MSHRRNLARRRVAGVVLALLLVAAPPARAAESAPSLADLERALPDSLGQARRVQPQGMRAPPDRLAAFYEGPMGRATILASPMPPGGAPADAVVADAARGALAQDLQEGTRALPQPYWTGEPDFQTLAVENGPVLACGALERRAGQQAPMANQARLLNRRCFTVIGDKLVGMLLTTPFREDASGPAGRQCEFIVALARLLAAAAR